MDTSTAKSEKTKTEGLSEFPKVKSKSYQPEMKQNNSTEISGLSFLFKIYNKNGSPQTPPQTPNPFFWISMIVHE